MCPRQRSRRLSLDRRSEAYTNAGEAVGPSALSKKEKERKKEGNRSERDKKEEERKEVMEGRKETRKETKPRKEKSPGVYLFHGAGLLLCIRQPQTQPSKDTTEIDTERHTSS